MTKSSTTERLTRPNPAASRRPAIVRLRWACSPLYRWRLPQGWRRGVLLDSCASPSRPHRSTPPGTPCSRCGGPPTTSRCSSPAGPSTTSTRFTATHAGPCLEGWITLTALAQATRRLRLGTLVTGIHYRHPAVLANMAATLDVISGGRLELGIGAGWNEEESGAYGIELGTPEGAQRPVRRGLRGHHRTAHRRRPPTFAGSYYQLTDARCDPKPVQRPHPPICIGGSGEQRTLRTAARFAQHWNFVGGTPAQFSQASAMCCTSTAPTSAATRRRSCCPATCVYTGDPAADRGHRRRARRGRAWSWPSSTCRPPHTPGRAGAAGNSPGLPDLASRPLSALRKPGSIAG